MRDKITILIVDDNVEFLCLLSEYISREKDLQVIGAVSDGIQALEAIQRLKPDVVLLDIIMPNIDGIGVLEKMSESGLDKMPVFIMLTAVGQDMIIRKAFFLGAEYYIAKPFNSNILVERIRQVYIEKDSKNRVKKLSDNIANARPAQRTVGGEDSSNKELEKLVTDLIRDAGIPAHMSGYQYLREAIIQVVNDSNVFSCVTKVLYPKVAKKFNTTPQRVERGIRNAIESAWSKGTQEIEDSMFNGINGKLKCKPTNSEFIALISDRIRIKRRNRKI